MEAFTDRKQGDNSNFKLDGYDHLDLESDEDDQDDDDDTGNYENCDVGKKRKRVAFAALDSDLNHSRQTNERIKNGGGEAFILDESTSDLSQQQNARMYGTFGRRTFDPTLLKLETLTTSRRPSKGRGSAGLPQESVCGARL